MTNDTAGPKFAAGDRVTHPDWGRDTAVIETVDSENFPDDPVAFFVNGGFWRTSRLLHARGEEPTADKGKE